ncbi:hypothetical protein [Streptomyces sp. NPDC056987]|uniref:hypothetical protein n=1 Tax=Streptomyces sp. NPDC056987 TaxID=3345988 RepID=UPI00363054DA
MPSFLFALLLGALSGGGTYLYTDAAALAVIVGLVVFVAAWLGVFAIVLFDD